MYRPCAIVRKKRKQNLILPHKNKHQYHGKFEPNSKWLATRHASRVRSRSPASADTGVVVIGNAPLSQSVLQKHDYYRQAHSNNIFA